MTTPYRITTARAGDLRFLAAIELAAARLLAGYAPKTVLKGGTADANLQAARRDGRLWVALWNDPSVSRASRSWSLTLHISTRSTFIRNTAAEALFSLSGCLEANQLRIVPPNWLIRSAINACTGSGSNGPRGRHGYPGPFEPDDLARTALVFHHELADESVGVLNDADLRRTVREVVDAVERDVEHVIVPVISDPDDARAMHGRPIAGEAAPRR